MDTAGPSSQNDELCKLCNINSHRYVCPKCGIPYCSIECYKSTAHLECSEEFYKKCVEEELQVQQCDSDVKKKTLDILQRIYNQEIEEEDILSEILQNADEEEEELDSDDDIVEALEKRLENVNLDNADELWSALNETERKEFEAWVKSGETANITPLWDPWWFRCTKTELIEEIKETNEEPTYVKECPKILDILALTSIEKVSPFLRFSIINAVYAYAFIILHFNGDHHTAAIDSVRTFLHICNSMKIDQVFKDSVSAIENVLLEIANCEALAGDPQTILRTKESGDAILNGPEKIYRTFYILSSLSDLHQLMEEAKNELSNKNKSKPSSNFKGHFHCEIDLGSLEISRKSLKLLLKKIEFYIAWVKAKGENYDITEGENMI